MSTEELEEDDGMTATGPRGTVWDMPDEMRMTRAEARDSDLLKYWDPVAPCKRHGQVIRYASNGVCCRCNTEHGYKYRQL